MLARLARSRSGPRARRLDVYVGPHCPACARARDLAERVRARAPVGVDVRIIDLSEHPDPVPASIFAIPTYLLDGDMLSLGNPDEAWLMARLGAGPADPGEMTRP